MSRVSVDSNGAQANGQSFEASISRDGRCVSFLSRATNLVAGDTNNWQDLFVRDLLTGVTTCESVNASGVPVGVDGSAATLSSDGRIVAFVSGSTEFDPIGAGIFVDVFVRDRVTGITKCAAVSFTGGSPDGVSHAPSLSADGRFVAFASQASNLVPGDNGTADDVFVRDLVLERTQRIAEVPTGVVAYGSVFPRLSADARFVVFISASALLAADVANGPDVYRFDRTTARLQLVAQPTGTVVYGSASVSDDGRFTAFATRTALDPTDANGEIDFYVHDSSLGQTALASGLTTGGSGNGECFLGAISPDGRALAFQSSSIDIAEGGDYFGRDVFVRDLTTGTNSHVAANTGEPSGTAQLDWSLAFNADSRLLAFSSNSSTLVANDTNGVRDVFVVDRTRTLYRDADSDGWGSPSASTIAFVVPAGFADASSDCDDANASVHPRALELDDGLDNDCDGLIDEGGSWSGPCCETYCTPSTTRAGCQPTISAYNVPTVHFPASAPFSIVVTGTDNDVKGRIFFGLSAALAPWPAGMTSTLCVAAPHERGYLNVVGPGNPCDGNLGLAWGTYMHFNPAALGQPLYPGQTYYAQGWFRDAVEPGRTNLSNALRFTLAP